VPASDQQWFDFSSSALAEEEAPAALLVAPRPAPPAAEAPPLVLEAPEPPSPVDEVVLRRSEKASRYRLSVGRDGIAVLTIPLRGSERQARQFLESQRDWLERARERLARLPRSAEVWTPGTSLLWRGEWCTILRTAEATPHVLLGRERIRVRQCDGDLRPTLEAHFRRIARIELPARTWELAAVTGVKVRDVSVRDQRARWGSCSASGTISLNWRLVQAVPFAADYIILHELMHLREMNHSERFWALVDEACPRWREAERWLKNHGGALGL
jgi:predicted metal-dependent hydrolase